MTPLLPFYGSQFCTHFTRTWRAIYGDGQYSPNTSYQYFKRTVRFFLVIAKKAIKDPHAAEAKVFKCYSLYRGETPETSDIEQCLANAFDDMCDRNNDNYGSISSPSAINSEIDTIKSVLWAFSSVGFCPKFTFSAGLPVSKEAKTPTMASLAIESGLFSIKDHGRLEAAEAFVKHNADMLMELRRALCEEFQAEYEKFSRGKRLQEDPSLPTCDEIVLLLREYKDDLGNIRDWFCRRLKISYAQYEGLVYKMASATRHAGMIVNTRKLATLINSGGSTQWVQGHIQATSVALNAAFHIVLIDSAFNSQPCKDLAVNAISGREKRGKFELVVRGTKNRKNGPPGSKKNQVEAPMIDESGWLPRKVGEQVSAKWVIERWLEMTSMLRTSPFIKAADKDRLWIFQRPLEPTIRSRLQSIDSEWWPAFLARHADNPMIGGLPVTRMVIRKTALNRNADMDDFGFAMNQAAGDHTDGPMAFFYLDKNGAKAILEEMIRKFLNKWEAIAVSGVAHAATVLGVSEQELYRRELLGLEAGLEFAFIKKNPEKELDQPQSAADQNKPLLDKKMRILRISDASMENLYLAKLGLDRQADRMITTNPARFLRTWLSWSALVEGYIQKIRESRFAPKYDRVISRVDMQLQNGQAAIPCLW